ncbi:hypothetical protein QR680_006968 [Steinernema hermaphroditum]|uniref:Uncharacterized protein n=1 Tax=Steinernema hermaphroditum TaxID=289476 RepID=A0AA39HYR5_9BILA|nr:hypothetical protein QR680_006968 [Steinernema hermaphroditum]
MESPFKTEFSSPELKYPLNDEQDAASSDESYSEEYCDAYTEVLNLREMASNSKENSNTRSEEVTEGRNKPCKDELDPITDSMTQPDAEASRQESTYDVKREAEDDYSGDAYTELPRQTEVAGNSEDVITENPTEDLSRLNAIQCKDEPNDYSPEDEHTHDYSDAHTEVLRLSEMAQNAEKKSEEVSDQGSMYTPQNHLDRSSSQDQYSDEHTNAYTEVLEAREMARNPGQSATVKTEDASDEESQTLLVDELVSPDDSGAISDENHPNRALETDSTYKTEEAPAEECQNSIEDELMSPDNSSAITEENHPNRAFETDSFYKTEEAPGQGSQNPIENELVSPNDSGAISDEYHPNKAFETDSTYKCAKCNQLINGRRDRRLRHVEIHLNLTITCPIKKCSSVCSYRCIRKHLKNCHKTTGERLPIKQRTSIKEQLDRIDYIVTRAETLYFPGGSVSNDVGHKPKSPKRDLTQAAMQVQDNTEAKVKGICMKCGGKGVDLRRKRDHVAKHMRLHVLCPFDNCSYFGVVQPLWMHMYGSHKLHSRGDLRGRQKVRLQNMLDAYNHEVDLVMDEYFC